jgi:hypothetical protein
MLQWLIFDRTQILESGTPSTSACLSHQALQHGLAQQMHSTTAPHNGSANEASHFTFDPEAED